MELKNELIIFQIPWLLFLVTPTQIARAQHLISHGVIRRQVNIFSQLRSSWTVSLVYNLTAFPRHIRDLDDALNTAQQMISVIEKEYQFQTTDSKLFQNNIYSIHILADKSYLHVLTQLKADINSLKRRHARLKSNEKAVNRNWSNQKANPALKTKMENK